MDELLQSLTHLETLVSDGGAKRGLALVAVLYMGYRLVKAAMRLWTSSGKELQAEFRALGSLLPGRSEDVRRALTPPDKVNPVEWYLSKLSGSIAGGAHQQLRGKKLRTHVIATVCQEVNSISAPVAAAEVSSLANLVFCIVGSKPDGQLLDLIGTDDIDDTRHAGCLKSMLLAKLGKVSTRKQRSIRATRRVVFVLSDNQRALEDLGIRAQQETAAEFNRRLPEILKLADEFGGIPSPASQTGANSGNSGGIDIGRSHRTVEHGSGGNNRLTANGKNS